MGGREHQRERTRRTLMKVAYREFGERGYDETTVDHIAAVAGTSARTFYRYFPSKDAVLAARAAEVTDAVLEQASASPTVRELLQLYVRELDRAMGQDDFEVVMRLLREHPRVADQAPLWRQRWADQLAAGFAVRAGTDRPTPECRLVSLLTISLVSFAIDEWVHREPGSDLETVAREVAAIADEAISGTSW